MKFSRILTGTLFVVGFASAVSVYAQTDSTKRGADLCESKAVRSPQPTGPSRLVRRQGRDFFETGEGCPSGATLVVDGDGVVDLCVSASRTLAQCPSNFNQDIIAGKQDRCISKCPPPSNPPHPCDPIVLPISCPAGSKLIIK